MYAMMVEELGGPESLRRVEGREPTPGPGEVVVATRAIGCNFYDTLITRGAYQRKPPLPFAPGAEAAGPVVAVGAKTDGISVGDRVSVLLPYGAYASHVVAPAHRAFPIPEAMGFEEAAAMGIVYQTSWLGLCDRGHLREGETLLVHAAAGGVGLAAVQIGTALGARVLGSAGSEEKRALARAHGAEHTFDYRDEAWLDQLRAEVPGGVDVVYDPVGGDVFDLSTKHLAFDARYVVVGFASGRIPTMKMNRVMLKNVAITGVYHGAYFDRAPERLRECQRALGELYERGAIRPQVSARYPLRDAAAALAALADRKTTGKIVLVP